MGIGLSVHAVDYQHVGVVLLKKHCILRIGRIKQVTYLLGFQRACPTIDFRLTNSVHLGIAKAGDIDRADHWLERMLQVGGWQSNRVLPEEMERSYTEILQIDYPLKIKHDLIIGFHAKLHNFKWGMFDGQV